MKVLTEFHVTPIEVPGEISIIISVPGCGGKCAGCHSPELHNEENGKEMSVGVFLELLSRYQGLATAVCFFGGEWCEDIRLYLEIAKLHGFKTCLYTCAEEIDVEHLKPVLTTLKTGAYIEDLGGLASETTNQKYINVSTGEDLTHLFRRRA